MISNNTILNNNNIIGVISMVRQRKHNNIAHKINSNNRTRNGHKDRSFIFYLIPVVFIGTLMYGLKSYMNRPAFNPNIPNQDMILDAGLYNISCNEEDTTYIDGCSPLYCARLVIDDFISKKESKQLINMLESALAITGGGSGPPSILDLSSGALSAGRHFVDVFKLDKARGFKFKRDDIELYKTIAARVERKVKEMFGLRTIYFTTPAFFSRINGNKDAVTKHDEYWHDHIDKLQYGSFVYTVLVYLNDQGKDYEGGLFEFTYDESPIKVSVKPQAGRILIFTSGEENPHHVAKVTKGVRYAITLAFTCDPKRGLTLNQLVRAEALK